MILEETYELLRQYSHWTEHKRMQLVRRFENGILGCLDAIWKGVFVGFLVRFEGKRRQAIRSEIVVDLIGLAGNDGCKLYYPTGRHCTPDRVLKQRRHQGRRKFETELKRKRNIVLRIVTYTSLPT